MGMMKMIEYVMMAGIVSFVGYMFYKRNKMLEENEQTYQEQSEQESSTSMIPDEAEIILGELTDLRARQAEVLGHIEDIQRGRYVDVSVKKEYGECTKLSQESILQALKMEDRTLSLEILQKSREFSKIMER
jgi:hypothetical protein